MYKKIQLKFNAEVKCEDCDKIFMIPTHKYETQKEYHRIFRCVECYNKYLKTFPKPVADRQGWWEMSPGYSVPEWIYREATFNKDGSMKEQIFDR